MACRLFHPVGSSSLIRGDRWQMPDSLFTQLFPSRSAPPFYSPLSPSPSPSPHRFLPCNYRSSLTGSRIKSFRGQSAGITAVCASTNRSRPDRPAFPPPYPPPPYPCPSTIIRAASGKSIFVVFSDDLFTR